MFEVYAQRDATRREHVGEIVTHLRLRTIQQSDDRTAILAAAASAVGTEKGEAIVRAILDDLKARRIMVPVASLVERFALAGRAWARRQAHRDLVRHLDPPTREQLEALLTTQTEEGRTVHGWISEVPEGPKLKNLVGVVARLDSLRRIGSPMSSARQSTPTATAFSAARRKSPTRASCWASHRSAGWPPSSPSSSSARRRSPTSPSRCYPMFDKLLGTAHRRAATSRRERLVGQAQTLTELARTHLVLGRALIDARRTNADLRQAIEDALGWDRLTARIDVTAGALGADEGDGLDALRRARRADWPTRLAA